VQRIAREVGLDMAKQRDQKTAQQRRRELLPRVKATPEVVAVEVDGGRLRTRTPGSGPGVHQPHGREDKVACLVTLQSEVHDEDPQPEPPPSFVQPRRVQRLVQQMQGLSGDKPAPSDEADEAGETGEADEPSSADARPGAPAKRVRTCLASMADSHAFGPMMAAEAQERDFYQAQRRAFLGDGAAYNWRIQRAYFPDFVAIADFLHVLCYVYLAAWAVGGDEEERWSIYVNWLWACWQGRVGAVITELQQHQQRVGEPPPDEALDAKDPRRLVAEALNYLSNNQERMDYPRYRRLGLPVTSSLVESLVGEFNARVKERGKFWDDPEGAEAILQLRAAVLSEDGRLERYFDQRPGNPYRRRQAG
jgi:hypothetical protein